MKVVEQPLIKLVGRLKDKIIYIHKTKDVKYNIKNIEHGGGKNVGLLECFQT